MNDKRRCCELVMGTGRYASFNKTPCTKPVRVTVDGKHYCAIHDPAKVAERRAKAKAEADARQEARNAHYEARKETERKAACFDTLVAALKRCEALLSDMREGVETEGCAEEEILLDVRAALKEAKP